jgi:hypothetical protein
MADTSLPHATAASYSGQDVPDTMADTPPPHATAISDSGQNVLGALGVSSSHDTTHVHKTSESYDTKDAHDMKFAPDKFETNDPEDAHGMGKAEAKEATHAVLDIVSLLRAPQAHRDTANFKIAGTPRDDLVIPPNQGPNPYSYGLEALAGIHPRLCHAQAQLVPRSCPGDRASRLRAREKFEMNPLHYP